jgi:hypothetical protein
MASLVEWQKQQKDLKDAERSRLRRANSFMHKYRGGEHAIKHQRQQMILKNAERDRIKRASIARHNYRGGEHDIKHEKQQKALRDAERERRKRASFARRNYRGGEHDIKYQKEQKVLKDAERDRREDASKMMHSHHGGEHDIKNYERNVIVERKRKNEARRRRSHRIRTAYERMDRSSSELSPSQLVSVAELAASFNETEHDNHTKDSRMMTATEIPMGSDQNVTNSRRNSVSLKSMVSFSSPQYFDDREADVDINFSNNDNGDEARNTEIYSIEGQYSGESPSIGSTNIFALDDSFISGDFDFDQTGSNEKYYDWAAIPSDVDSNSEADDNSHSTSRSICRSHSVVKNSINSGFTSSETSTSHLIPMGINERDYYDWTAAPSGTDSGSIITTHDTRHTTPSTDS